MASAGTSRPEFPPADYPALRELDPELMLATPSFEKPISVTAICRESGLL